MKRFSFIIAALLIIQFCAVSTAFSSDQSQIKRSINIIMMGIKHGKNNAAAAQVDFLQMAKNLMGSTWNQMTPAQQREFTNGVETLMRNKTFAKGREMFGYFDYINVLSVSLRGTKAKAKVYIVVNKLKKKYTIDFGYIKQGGIWKLEEIYLLGEGIIDTVRLEDVKPMLKKGGIPAVMNALREQLRKG